MSDSRLISDRRDDMGRRIRDERRLGMIPVAFDRRTGIDRRIATDRRSGRDRRYTARSIRQIL